MSKITYIKNELIDDANLRYEKIGLLVYILSKSEKESINLNELVESHQNSKGEVITIIRNLQDKGYFKKRDDKLLAKDFIFIEID